jgi:hypothetical protein
MGRHRKAPRTLSSTARTLFECPQFALARKGFTMSSTLFIDTPCPKCLKPVKACAIELHLTRRELAIQYFQCADCGDVEAKFHFTKAAQGA